MPSSMDVCKSSRSMPGSSAVMRSASPSSTTSMRGWNRDELKSPNHRSRPPTPANGSCSISPITRHGSDEKSRDTSGHSASHCFDVGVPDDDCSPLFSVCALRRNLNGFHLLRSVFISSSYKLHDDWCEVPLEKFDVAQACYAAKSKACTGSPNTPRLIS